MATEAGGELPKQESSTMVANFVIVAAKVECSNKSRIDFALLEVEGQD